MLLMFPGRFLGRLVNARYWASSASYSRTPQCVTECPRNSRETVDAATPSSRAILRTPNGTAIARAAWMNALSANVNRRYDLTGPPTGTTSTGKTRTPPTGAVCSSIPASMAHSFTAVILTPSIAATLDADRPRTNSRYAAARTSHAIFLVTPHPLT